jgi:hypothetical protein
MKIKKYQKFFKEEDQEITKEMRDWFYKRTKRHIELVQKYCQKINDLDSIKWRGILYRGKHHDQSKLQEPEITPYIKMTWYYKCKEDGIDYPYTNEMENAFIDHHVPSNRHHAEYFKDLEDMTDLDIAEMVADWSAMSEELGDNGPKEWADKKVGSKWKFNGKQKELIYDLIDGIWE